MVRLHTVAPIGALALLVGCSGGGAEIGPRGAPVPAGAGSSVHAGTASTAAVRPVPREAAASGAPAHDEPADAHRREIEAAKTKRDQCLRLGSVIDLVQPTEALVVEGSSAELSRMASALEHAATEIEQVPLDSRGIALLRTELTANWRQMASALSECATQAASERKSALARFREREASVPSLFDALSNLCNGPER